MALRGHKRREKHHLYFERQKSCLGVQDHAQGGGQAFKMSYLLEQIVKIHIKSVLVLDWQRNGKMKAACQPCAHRVFDYNFVKRVTVFEQFPLSGRSKA